MAKTFSKEVKRPPLNPGYKMRREIITIDKKWYNNSYSKHEGKKDSEYTKEPVDSWYYEGWAKVLDWTGLSDILDLGCGPGQFGKLCLERGIKYTGIDYSEVAIRMAGKMTGSPKRFRVGDITTFKRLHIRGGTVVLLEVLEHIVEDLEVLEKITQSLDIVFSVPNYNYRSHVRYFESIDAIKERYGHLMHIDDTYIVKLNDVGKKIFLIKGVRK